MMAVIFIIGALIGWFICTEINHVIVLPSKNTSNTQVRVILPQYNLIAPPLFSETAQSVSPAFKVLKSAITEYIATATSSGEVDSVSVYFRDLNHAEWTGVNENETYTPASMLKVVAMMGALKLAEENPPLINQKLPYIASSSPFAQYYKPDDNMKTGSYSVQYLIGQMIRYSDNDALYSLLLDPQINSEFNEIYSLYRLPQYSATDTVDFMSPKSYSTLFISLYNSSLFEWSLSEQILNLLANTTFTQGLVAGVPAGTIVAHKFGENTNLNAQGVAVDHELHDCGIVYVPGKPYILCVMTRGSANSTFPKLAGVISNISRLVYNIVSPENSGL